MTFNTFLIPCIPTAKCQEDDAKEVRVAEIVAWFQDRDEDIILLQELWSFHDEIRDGLTSAGYCHYVMTDRINGSGLAIFSKHPIETSDCEFVLCVVHHVLFVYSLTKTCVELQYSYGLV